MLARTTDLVHVNNVPVNVKHLNPLAIQLEVVRGGGVGGLL
jgi:hypothetical protein